MDTQLDGHVPARRQARPGWVLVLVCVGQFMVVLDVSIVTVALPQMKIDLGFSTAGLQWVVTAYTVAFAGFLLLGGRAGDLFGRRRMFLVGLGLFTGASLLCGLAQDQAMVVIARGMQGLGGAVLSPATLTILSTTYTEPKARAKALGVWSAMAAAGGASGALFGGILTDLLNWRWIFFINLPVGIFTIIAARLFLPETRGVRQRLDVVGALTVTGALVAFVYGIVNTQSHSWGSASTMGYLALAVVLFAAFVVVETKVAPAPMVPLRMFRSRSLSAANATMVLATGAMFSMWFFMTLYLQEVLGLSPLLAGLGFLPGTVGIATAATLSAKLVPRYGPVPPLLVGCALDAGGLLWLSQIGAHGNYFVSVLGGSVIATFGAGMIMVPLTYAATHGVRPEDAGLASGILNTSRQVGASICLAVLVTVAAARTRSLAPHGLVTRPTHSGPLTSGYGAAFLVSAGLAVAAALVALTIPRGSPEATPAADTRMAAPPDELAPALGEVCQRG